MLKDYAVNYLHWVMILYQPSTGHSLIQISSSSGETLLLPAISLRFPCRCLGDTCARQGRQSCTSEPAKNSEGP